jgi:hyaluronan synthase
LFTFILQVRDTLQHGGPVHLFTMFIAIVWILWAVKVVLSRRYQPFTAPYRPSSSVIIPVVDEPPELFRKVLYRVCQQEPDETMVVINGPRNLELEAICKEFAQQHLEWTWTPTASKRNAIRIGVEATFGDVVVLVDSDTIWTQETLAELLRPFADPQVGGVTTKQRIHAPDRNLLTRWADWLENSRALYAMPAQSVLGQVGCLPGRTIAFRREILVRAMPAFMHERFLGIFLEISDDRALTNYALKQGYRTVFQATSLVYTDAPTSIGKLSRQQYRWARGSQYNSLRMLPWMVTHTPVLALFFFADIFLPFLLLGSVVVWAYHLITGTGTNLYAGFLATYGWRHGVLSIGALTLVASSLSMAIRHQRHLQERPDDLVRLPIFVLISTFFLMPIRLYGFFRMAHAGDWGTRQHGYAARAPVPGDVGPNAEPLQPTEPFAPRRNPWALLPSLLGVSLFLLGVFYDH